MMHSLPGKRLLLAGAAFVGVAAAACSPDSLAGPTVQVGDPLLDITLSPAAAFAYPSGSYDIRANRDTLLVTLNNLPPLPAGANYQLFLVDSLTTDSAGTNNLVPVGGQLVVTTRSSRPVTRDSSVRLTAVETTPNATVIAAADTNRSFAFTITSAGSGVDLSRFSHVVVGVVPAAGAPGRLERGVVKGFLYGQYINQRGTANRGDDSPVDGALRFGSFSVDQARRQQFAAVGGPFDGAFWGEQVRLNLRALPRPPEGFRYALWLIDDRTGKQVRVGGLLTPVDSLRRPSTSLDDADVGTGAFLSQSAILQAQARGNASELGIVFDDFTRVTVLLEPKGTGVPTTASAAHVVAGPVPTSVGVRHASAGKLFGRVQQGTTPVVGATVYLTGVGQTNSLVVTNTNAEGIFGFRTANVGQYTIHAIPPGGTAPAVSQPVTIGQTGLVGDSVFVTLTIP